MADKTELKSSISKCFSLLFQPDMLRIPKPKLRITWNPSCDELHKRHGTFIKLVKNTNNKK